MTVDLGTTNTRLCAVHTCTELTTVLAAVFDEVLSEVGVRDPILQERTLVVLGLDVGTEVLYAVVHGIRDVEHAIYSTEPINITKGTDIKVQVLAE